MSMERNELGWLWGGGGWESLHFRRLFQSPFLGVIPKGVFVAIN